MTKFGPELRRRRLAAGMTLDDLAARVHYSKGQLSKVETGRQRPSPELARLCDAVLGAGGELSALAPGGPAGTAPGGAAHGGGSASAAGGSRPTRRQVMTAGAASALGLGAVPALGLGAPSVLPLGTGPAPGPAAVTVASAADVYGSTVHQGIEALFHEFRRLGQTAPASVVLPALAAQTRALPSLAMSTGGRTRQSLLLLTSRYAEFTGWMAQESGDDAGALEWTAHAVGLADAAGDRDLAAYSLVRRGLITLYGGDAGATVEAAQGAQGRRLPPRIRGLAAQREAQGHALRGDRDACFRALERARDLLARAADADASETAAFGTTHVDDPAAMTAGWCLLDLGLPRQAAEALDREVVRLPHHALRSRVRYGARRALAYALSGEIDHACALARPLLAEGEALASATIRVDVRRLSRVLARHPKNDAVRALSPRLAAALHPSAHLVHDREEAPRV
ncbi:XRE family transcriptional regulator [Streptomyces venezuelae]|uniref:helix-turn-helix domain-containing protein n=1 Tax=Streptomyces venezuelae TaxID=54571 RepID=UPI00123AE5C5|nr:helix-turn-helix transcriptional regulator [Streptomyces venezuelae]QES05051.1 XRE family transcriptional regulator [Streptomyces venezuelae]